MEINSGYTDVPPQFNNPTDEQRDFLTYYVLLFYLKYNNNTKKRFLSKKH